MSEFNPELVRALAHGDTQAQEQIKNLPTTMRMSLFIAVDDLRRKENIVPMNSEGMNIFVQKESPVDNDSLGQALAERNKRLREAEELKEKIRQEHIEKIAKQEAARARAGLARFHRN
ncbi:hypothetical protein [Niallia sp. 03133]|uniref:hypothetical protein n=1 Tax=Niallia sp. 03133 TaxID=3458060 RepID=UPI004043C6AF